MNLLTMARQAACLSLVAAGVLLAGCGAGTGQSEVSEKAQAPRHTQKMAATSPYDMVVQQLYVAYFGRPADTGGLANFEAALAAAGAPTDAHGLLLAYSTNSAVKALVDSFGSSAESNALYGSGTTQQFITAIFMDVLGRAPAQEGLTFYTNAIEQGTMTQGAAALWIMVGAQTNTTAQGLLDAQLINNRLALADQFTASLSSSIFGSDYRGSAAAAIARGMLSGVSAGTATSTFGGLIDATMRAMTGNSAQYNTPTGIAVDANGIVYVSDSLNQEIRKIALDGTVTTLAGKVGVVGSADGTGSAASFSYPNDIAVDTAGNIYVAVNDAIRKITPGGVVTTLAGKSSAIGYADGFGASAIFNGLYALAVDDSGNIYTTESGNNVIRKVSPQGMVTTIAGTVGVAGSADGAALQASFNAPGGIAVDAAGNLYVADCGNSTIRKITAGGMVSTLAGSAKQTGSNDGTGAAARFNGPIGVAVDAAGTVAVSDQGNSTIRKISPQGVVTTFAGTAGAFASVDGQGSNARFDFPMQIAFDSVGNLYVADMLGEDIRMITPGGYVSTISGSAGINGSFNGGGSSVALKNPTGIAMGADGTFYIGDAGESVVVTMNSADVITTLAGSVGTYGTADGTKTAAQFYWPDGIAVDAARNVYVADVTANTIRKISSAGVVTTLAGTAKTSGSTDGVGSAARFSEPTDVAVDAAGNVYVTDSYNATIRKILPDGTVSTFAGKAGVTGAVDGAGSNVLFNIPKALTIDGAGNLYVAEDGNADIRKITPQGVVTTIAGKPGNSPALDGTGLAAGFFLPQGIALDAAGNLYVSDWNTIRKITPAGVVTTLVGTAGVSGFSDGIGAAASFNSIMGIVVDASGNIIAIDQNNAAIRKITPAGVVTTIQGVAPQ